MKFTITGECQLAASLQLTRVTASMAGCADTIYELFYIIEFCSMHGIGFGPGNVFNGCRRGPMCYSLGMVAGLVV